MSLQCKVMEVLVLGFQKSFSVQKYIFKIVSYVTVLWFCFSRAGDLHLLLIFFFVFISETAYPADARGKNYTDFTRQ